MKEDIKKVHNALFIWKVKRAFSENSIRNFIQHIIVKKEYLQPDGICQVTLLSGLSLKNNDTYIFSIQAHSHLHPMDTNINFYLSGKYMIAQCYEDKEVVNHFISLFNFFRNLENYHDMKGIFDKDKRNKIQLELMG